MGGALSGPVDFPAATEQAGLDRRWSLRDIPRAIPISFDPRTLLVGAVGLFLASAAFGMAHWLGVKTGEAAAGNVFNIVSIPTEGGTKTYTRLPGSLFQLDFP